MFQDTLNWLTSTDGGALLLVMWAVSWGLEEFPQWQALHSKVKSLIILGVAAIVAVLAAVLSNYPEAIEAVDPYFTPVYYVALAWLATQTVHKINVGRKARG